jgi:hypothetical protein
MGRIDEYMWLRMAGAYPQDDQDDSSESDTSNRNAGVPEAASGPGSSRQQSDGQQDEVMDALGDAFKRSFPGIGGIYQQAVQCALDELEKQRRHDSVQGSSEPQEPAPNGTAAWLPESVDSAQKKPPFVSGSADTPTATPHIANHFFDNAVTTGGLFTSNKESSTAYPARHTLFTAQAPSGGFFHQTAESRAISLPTSLFDYKGSPGDLFAHTAKPSSKPSYELKWPVQASEDQEEAAPTTDPPKVVPDTPQSLFDNDISSGSLFKYIADDSATPSIFNALGQKPTHTAGPIRPDAPKGLFGRNFALSGNAESGASSPSFGSSVQTPPTTSLPPACPLPPGQFVWGGRAQSGNVFGRNHALELFRTPRPNFNWKTQAFGTEVKTTPNAGLPEAAPTVNSGNKPQSVSSKRQCEDMHPSDNPTNEDEAPAKRPFGQTRLPKSKSRSKTDLVDATIIPRPDLGAYQSMIQELTNSHPVAFRISSSEKFIETAMKSLDLDGINTDLITQCLGMLYDLIVSYTEVVILNTRNTHEHEKTVSDIEKQVQKLNHKWPQGSGDPLHELTSLNEQLRPLQEQKERCQHLMETNKIDLSSERDKFVLLILGSLEMINKFSRPQNNVEEKYVSELLVTVIALEQELKDAKDDHASSKISTPLVLMTPIQILAYTRKPQPRLRN